ncbi:metallophosphoesterase [Candidatus Pacearchaeota archaeon]|nr:metallophosphoesterase [Candidatus Pacearchaeota archaeon]
MDEKEILKFCIERGLLIEPDVLSLFNEIVDDTESVKLIIEKIKSHTQKRIITRSLFEQNKEQVTEFFLTLPKENQKSLEKLKIKLGLQIEISRLSQVQSEIPSISQAKEDRQYSEEQLDETQSDDSLEQDEDSSVKVLLKPISTKKKIEVDDFVKNLRNRFAEMKNILQEHSELENLVSINKLSGGKKFSIIGMVFEKRVTKNRNIIFSVEDSTGRTKVLINQNKPELYKKAEEVALDSIIGFSGNGDREILFASNIVFPGAVNPERKKAPAEEYALFIGDIHYGSNVFMEENFLRFINYVNGKVPNSKEADKIKYIFIVGDLVSGVGVYPSQKKDLKIDDLEEQFRGFAELIGRIKKDIKIIISPGNHDGVRLLEPQPALDEKYSWPLYNLKNVILTGNPSYVNIASGKDFSGFDVLTYHGFSYPYYANVVPSLVSEGLNSPEKVMSYLLKNRHLAPTYSSVQAFPSEKDELVIKKVPDIFVSGHTHKCAVSYYNNVLVISVSGWEEETEYQKRKGNTPDFCKVPMVNLKTGAIKILDFE